MSPTDPAPDDFPRISSALFYRDAAKAIDWLCDAFGFEVRLKILDNDGMVMHSELFYGEGLIMVAQEKTENLNHPWQGSLKSPLSLNGMSTQSLMLYVDNADEHCARARSYGAEIVEEPADHDYGEDYWADRSYGAKDIEGHIWWITQRLRNAAG